MENELVVRLVECAKPLNSVYDSNDPTQVLVTGWADTTTVPKRGEICLEYYTNTDSSSENYGKICYRMKIGDGIHKYIESNPDDSLPYFPLSDDVINLIASWVNTHLNVNEYAQANYNNSTNTLKIYSINEEYGKIGHLADSEDTPSLDIEVTFSAGTKIDLASVDNTLTITHEDTTRSDSNNNTDIIATTNVVTGVTTDATGHVTGITTYKFPANPVEATSTYSAKKIMYANGTNKTKESDVEVTATAPTSTSDDKSVPTSKAVDTAIKNRISELDSSVSADANKVLTGVTQTDGNLSGKTDVAYTTIAPVQSVAGDNTWTSVSTSSNTATVSHIGPSTEDSNKSITEVAKDTHILTGISIDAKGHVRTKPDTKELTVETGGKIAFGTLDASTIQLVHVETDRRDDPQSGNMSFGTAVVTGVTTDDYGHVTCVTTKAIPENPVSGLEGTASDTASGITVQVDSTGGEVDNVDVTVALDTLKSALGLTGALIPKGTIGTGGTITTLPTASASNLGWAYKVITNGTYGGIQAKVGDVIYCILNDDGTTYSWTLIPSGDESFTDTWRNIKVNGTEKLGTGISSGALNIVNGSHSSATWNSTNSTLQIDVDEASTSQKGVVELTDSYTSTDDTKAATGKSIKAAIDELDVATDKGAASISGTTLTIKAVQQEDGKIKDGGTTTINLESSYDASTNKIATQKTVADAIEALDGNATATDTGTGANVITEVSETNGILSSKQKTITEGNKIDVTGASGSITIAHESITTTPTDNSVDPPNGLGEGERESYVITDVTTDGYGHITAYTKDKSTNLIAADIKAPVRMTDDSMWSFRETGGYNADGTNKSIQEDIAKIPVLKGKTLVWNQIVSNGNFINTAGWISEGTEYTTFSVSNNEVHAVTTNGSYGIYQNQPSFVGGHKYLLRGDLKVNNSAHAVTVRFAGEDTNQSVNSLTYSHLSYVCELNTSRASVMIIGMTSGSFEWWAKNVQVIDLTKMFGAGNEPTAEQFEAMFPNSYYPYCEGRLVNLGGYGVKWNQKAELPLICIQATYSNGIYDCNPTNGAMVVESSTLPTVGHKYYMSFMFRNDGQSTANTSIFCGNIVASAAIPANSTWGKFSYIHTVANLNNGFGFSGYATDNVPYKAKNIMLIDLTVMFGSGNEPSLEECEQIFTEDYYEYNTGYDCNILDVANKKLGLESTGFNQWDEEWNIGSLDGKTGAETPASGTLRTSFISVISNKQYYTKYSSSGNAYVFYYNENKQFVSYETITSHLFVPLTGIYFIRIIYDGYFVNNSTYNHDICINISCDRNGQYEPYKSDTLDLDWIREIEYTPEGSSTPEKLFPYGLLSAGSVHDEVTETKAIKRIGMVDLGNLIWGKTTQNEIVRFETILPINAKQDSEYTFANETNACGYISSYRPIAANDLNMGMSLYLGSIYLRNDSYTNSTVAEFTAGMSRKYLTCELATPIEIPLDQPHNMTYAVADHGTEQQLPINVSSVINAPFRGTFEYMSNFKEGVLDLMGRFNDFTPTTKIIPDNTTANSTLPTSQAVIDYMRAGGNGVKPVYESGDEVTPTTDVHAGLKTEVGNNSYKYYKIPFSAVTNDPSTGTSQVQIILNGNFS